MKISGTVHEPTAKKIAAVLIEMGVRDSVSFVCERCGWRVRIHATDPPHFEHVPDNPKECYAPPS